MAFDGCKIIPALNNLEEREHVELLVAKLIHTDPSRRRKGAEALASYIGEQRCLPPEEIEPHPAAVLAEAATEPLQSKLIILSCVRAVSMMESFAAPYASAALAKLMTHMDTEIRWETATALGFVGPGAAHEAAEALGLVVEEDEFALVRVSACNALRLMGPAAAEGGAQSLALALQDPDLDVQGAAIRALLAMGPAAAEYAGAEVVQTVVSGRYEMRRIACDVLYGMGEAVAERAAEELAHILRPDGLPWCSGASPPASDVVLRRKAAETLGALGQSAIALHQVKLSRALGDPDRLVREAAAKTLKLGGCAIATKGSTALGELATRDGADEMAFIFDAREEEALRDETQRAIKAGDDEKDLGRSVAQQRLRTIEAARRRNHQRVGDFLERHTIGEAARIYTWMIEEMGVGSVAEISLLGDKELMEQGLDEEQVKGLLAAAKVAEQRESLENLLRENKALDLINWMTDEVDVKGPADVAQLSEDDLVEECFMSRAQAKQLIQAARELIAPPVPQYARCWCGADHLEEDHDKLGKVTREHAQCGLCWCGLDHEDIGRREKQAREEALARELAHTDQGMCWCGKDHGLEQRLEEARVQERVRLKEQERRLRDEDEQLKGTVQELNARVEEEKRMKRVQYSENSTKTYVEAKELLRKKEEKRQAEIKRKDEVKRTEGLRARAAWSQTSGIVFSGDRWSDIPLNERLALMERSGTGTEPPQSAAWQAAAAAAAAEIAAKAAAKPKSRAATTAVASGSSGAANAGTVEPGSGATLEAAGVDSSTAASPSAGGGERAERTRGAEGAEGAGGAGSAGHRGVAKSSGGADGAGGSGGYPHATQPVGDLSGTLVTTPGDPAKAPSPSEEVELDRQAAVAGALKAKAASASASDGS